MPAYLKYVNRLSITFIYLPVGLENFHEIIMTPKVLNYCAKDKGKKNNKFKVAISKHRLFQNW